MGDRLVTRSFICILAANFLLYFGFWLLVPVLPFYLKETFSCGEAAVGTILSCYTVSALCTRPFMGYLYDGFARKPIYIMAYLLFTAIFAGYVLTSLLAVFILLRAVHGVAFGTVTVGGNTLVIDITPSNRRGEALGYYGLTNNVAMSIGPMTGLFLHDSHLSYEHIFSIGLLTCVLGFLAAVSVKAPRKVPVKRPPVSLDRFILLKGIPAGISLLLLSIPYGMTTNYVAMYARQIGITAETGFFFTCMALGMAVSRLFSGRLVDKGLVTQVISAGLYLVCFCYFSLTACGWLVSWNLTATTVFFFVIALLLGIGFGTMSPAYNTLFVNLAPNSQRGTATSTYLTSWDVGLGIGMLTGGYIAEIASFRMAYLFGSALTVVSMLYFRVKAGPHFLKNKLR